MNTPLVTKDPTEEPTLAVSSSTLVEEYKSPIIIPSPQLLQPYSSKYQRFERLFGTATWLVVALFVIVQLFILIQAKNGPFFDEGIYITAGQRAWQGLGVNDQYMTWFAGSLLWPMLSALGFANGGILGTRLIALLLTTLALLAAVRATQNLFGQEVGFWTAATFILSGPLLAQAHLATYDVLALAGVSGSFWAITELLKRDHRLYLVLATLSFSLGVLAKYPTILFVIPLVALIIMLRGSHARLDLGLFFFISAPILIVYYQTFQDQLIKFLPWRLANNPNFGATSGTIGWDVAFITFIPLLLGLSGWLAIGSKQRTIATILLSTLAIWPLYHLSSGNSVSLNKHIILSYLFVYPLVGYGLAVATRRWFGWLVVIMCLLAVGWFGNWQMDKFDRTWPDVRPATQYLAAHVQPGQTLLINNSWSYTLYLYSEGYINSPWDVYDVYRMAENGGRSVCEYSWFVDEAGSYSWPATVQAEIAACGTFEKVLTVTSQVYSLENMTMVVTSVPTNIWRNTAPKSLPITGLR